MPDIRKYMRTKRAVAEKRQGIPAPSEDREYEEKLKKHRRSVFLWGAVTLILTLLLIGIVSTIYRNRQYDEMEVVEKITREESMMSEYYTLEDMILRCSRDGAACVDEKGRTVWDLSFEMTRPLVDVCESFAVIAEAGGNKLYIVNGDGRQGEMETALPIRQIRVASQGTVVVVLEDGNKNWINFYNKEGELLAENKAPLSSKGYPLSIDVSNDGKKLAVSFVQIDGAKTESVVAFYNFDSVGYNVTDHLMSSTVYEDTLFPTIAFLSNNVAVAFGDNLCVGYEGTQNPEEIFKLSFKEKIKSIFYDADHFGIVLQPETSDKAYQMKVYSRNGKQLFTLDFDLNYEKIKFIEDEIVIFGQQEFSVYNLKGKLKYNGTNKKAMSDVMGIGKKYEYMVLYKTEWEKVRLK